MKKIILIITISIILVSCWNNQLWMNIEDDVNNSKINSGSSISSIETTDNETDVNNTEINDDLSINKIETVEVEAITNNKKLIMKNYNVFVQEEGKEDIVLTTKASWQKECRSDNWYEPFITYEIMQDSWKFWLIEKTLNSCAWRVIITHFTINLNNNLNKDSVVTEIKERTYWEYLDEIKVEDEKLVLKIRSDIIVDEIEERYQISKNEIINSWFIQKWDFWIKYIDLNSIDPDNF